MDGIVSLSWDLAQVHRTAKGFPAHILHQKSTRAFFHCPTSPPSPHAPPSAIGTTPPKPHSRLTSTRAPRPHGTPQEQPAARPEVPAIPEALAKDSRAKEHDALKARRPTRPPAAIGTTPHTSTPSISNAKVPRCAQHRRRLWPMRDQSYGHKESIQTPATCQATIGKLSKAP